MSGRQWSAEELADLHLVWEEFSALHPQRTWKAWRVMRHYKDRMEPVEIPKATYVDRPPTLEGEAAEKYFDKLIEAQEEKLDHRDKQVEATFEIETDLPIGIAFTGDWHVGAGGTDHKALKADVQRLSEADGIYVGLMGDLTHNIKANSKQADGLYDSIFPNPQDQEQFAWLQLEKLESKVLWMIRGCHEDFNRKLAGLDSISAVAQKLGAANLWHGGVIHLHVGEEWYHIGARHKYGDESGTNTTNAQRRFFDCYPEAENLDAVVLAHRHFNDLQKIARKGGYVTYARSGSYFVWDEYAQKQAKGYRGEKGIPIVILYPDRHKLIPFHGADLDTALNMLELARLAP